jgi:1,4-dihydroxy-2-naphthoate octaprenyltransferase
LIAILTAIFRPPFSLLTIVCVLLGASTVMLTQAPFDSLLFWLVLAGVLLAHCSVNAFNEYADFKSGLDFITEKTSFSGGSGSLPDNPEQAGRALGLAWFCLLAGIAIGFYLAYLQGLVIIPVILLAIAAILFYSNWATRHPIVCLLLPGFCFGILVVTASAYVMSGSYSSSAIMLSLLPFFQINNLLLLNQYPDIHADRQVGRRNILIAYGERTGALVFTLFYLLSYLVLALFVLYGYLPVMASLGLLTVPAAVFVVVGVYRAVDDIDKLKRYLGINVAVVLLTPLLIATGLVFNAL